MLARIFNRLIEGYRAWRRREQAMDELFALDDRSLADLGISRSEIPYIVSRMPETVAPIEEKHETLRRAA
jgi:uncharacterized protein YjiS (DUF1127 family)